MSDGYFNCKGYSPTLDELLADVGASTELDLWEKVFEKSKEIYTNSIANNNLHSYGTRQDFSLCNSSDFYDSFVNMGNGNASMIIVKQVPLEPYFLMFEDKAPEAFRPIIAAHEAREFQAMRDGISPEKAHKVGSKMEILKAKQMDVLFDYMRFIRDEYPGKFEELIEYGYF